MGHRYPSIPVARWDIGVHGALPPVLTRLYVLRHLSLGPLVAGATCRWGHLLSVKRKALTMNMYPSSSIRPRFRTVHVLTCVYAMGYMHKDRMRRWQT